MASTGSRRFSSVSINNLLVLRRNLTNIFDWGGIFKFWPKEFGFFCLSKIGIVSSFRECLVVSGGLGWETWLASFTLVVSGELSNNLAANTQLHNDSTSKWLHPMNHFLPLTPSNVRHLLNIKKHFPAGKLCIYCSPQIHFGSIIQNIYSANG